MSNPVVHFEINGRDAAALRRFYTDAFGWKVDANNPMQYGMVEAGASGIGGGIAQGDAPSALFYIEVDDPAAYLKKVVALGGKVVQDVVESPEMVTFAQFTDPEGTRIGLVKAE